MTVVTALTGNDAEITINGKVVAMSDFSLRITGGTISQPRVGYSTPRKLPGIKDVDFSLTNLDIDGEMMSLAMADSIPTCARNVVENCDASSNWVTSDITVVTLSDETTIKREGTGAVKCVCTGDPSGETITAAVTEDLSTAHILEFWVRSSVTGAIGTFGFGEAAYTEQTQAVTIKTANTWQREIIFLSDISSAARNAITEVGFVFATAATGATIYFDNINALTGFTFGKGQYFTLTATCKDPSDDTKYVDIFVPDAFLTGGDIAFGAADKVIDGPTSGSVKDASKVVIAYSQ